MTENPKKGIYKVLFWAKKILAHQNIHEFSKTDEKCFRKTLYGFSLFDNFRYRKIPILRLRGIFQNCL